MEEKLREILNKNQGLVEKHDFEIERLRYALRLYEKHGFTEEERIANLKIITLQNIVIDYRMMHREISELLDK